MAKKWSFSDFNRGKRPKRTRFSKSWPRPKVQKKTFWPKLKKKSNRQKKEPNKRKMGFLKKLKRLNKTRIRKSKTSKRR